MTFLSVLKEKNEEYKRKQKQAEQAKKEPEEETKKQNRRELLKLCQQVLKEGEAEEVEFKYGWVCDEPGMIRWNQGNRPRECLVRNILERTFIDWKVDYDTMMEDIEIAVYRQGTNIQLIVRLCMENENATGRESKLHDDITANYEIEKFTGQRWQAVEPNKYRLTIDPHQTVLTMTLKENEWTMDKDCPAMKSKDGQREKTVNTEKLSDAMDKNQEEPLDLMSEIDRILEKNKTRKTKKQQTKIIRTLRRLTDSFGGDYVSCSLEKHSKFDSKKSLPNEEKDKKRLLKVMCYMIGSNTRPLVRKRLGWGMILKKEGEKYDIDLVLRNDPSGAESFPNLYKDILDRVWACNTSYEDLGVWNVQSREPDVRMTVRLYE